MYVDTLPTDGQLNITKSMIQCGIDSNFIVEDYVLFGHRDVRDTECPGEALYQEILTWPHKGLPLTKKYKTN